MFYPLISRVAKMFYPSSSWFGTGIPIDGLPSGRRGPRDSGEQERSRGRAEAESVRAHVRVPRRTHGQRRRDAHVSVTCGWFPQGRWVLAVGLVLGTVLAGWFVMWSLVLSSIPFFRCVVPRPEARLWGNWHVRLH